MTEDVTLSVRSDVSFGVLVFLAGERVIGTKTATHFGPGSVPTRWQYQIEITAEEAKLAGRQVGSAISDTIDVTEQLDAGQFVEIDFSR